MTMNDRSLLVGIDGNEANVENRVGVNQFAYGLLWAFWRLKTAHNFVVYLSTQPLPSLPKEKDNWHYRVIGPPGFWTQWRLPLDLFSQTPRPDVFFTPSHYAPRFAPMPTVISVMDLGFLKAPEQLTKKDYFQLKSWTSYSVKGAAQVIAISEATKRDIEEVYAVSAEKITVVYPGYDRDRFFPRKPAEVRRVLEKHHIEGPYFLFLSSLKPSKNIERLVEAFSQLVQSRSLPEDIKLVIAGKKAWLYEMIFAKVKGLGITERVVFTGFFPEEDLPYLISGAAAFILPSLFEGFGIPVVEAMACEVPVVVSQVASLPEVAGPAGIYVNPMDTKDIARGLKTALSLTSARRRKLTNRGATHIERFDWDRSAKKTLEVLENVVFRKH